MAEQNTQNKEDIKVVLKEVIEEEALKEEALKKETQKKKAALQKPIVVYPKAPKPDGFVEVHFEYDGQDKKKKGKIFVSYVSPAIADVYRKSMEKTHDKRKKLRTGIVKIK